MSVVVSQDYLCDISLEICLIFLILFSPLIYGSITIFPLSIIESISFLALFIFLLNALLKNKLALIKIPFLSFFLFLLLILFQVFPLPRDLLYFLSPSTTTLYKEFRVSNSENFTLSIYPEATVNLLLQTLSLLAVFFIVLNYINSEKKASRLILYVIISGFIYSIIGIVRRLSISAPEFSTFTNGNHFSAYVQMIIPLGIVFSLTSRSRPAKAIFAFAASTMILVLFLSLSRAGRICFSLNLLLFFILLRIKRRIKRTISVVLILFIFLSMFIWFFGWGQITQRLETLASPLKEYSERLSVISDSFKILKDFPLFGTGFGTFGEIFQKYKTFNNQSTWSFSHNEPVQFLVETGIVGFLLILFFFIRYVVRIFSLWLKRNSPFAVYITLGCLIGIFSILSHSLFDFVLHVPANALLFFIILALAYRVVYLKEQQNLLPIPKYEIAFPEYLKPIFIILLFLSLILIESRIWRQYQAVVTFEKVRNKNILVSSSDAIIEYKKALRDIDKTIILDPSNSRYLAKKADLLLEIVSREDLKDELSALDNFSDSTKLTLFARSIYIKAIGLNPTKADYHLRLGWLYANLGLKDLAGKEFKDSLLLDPQNEKIKSYVKEEMREVE